MNSSRLFSIGVTVVLIPVMIMVFRYIDLEQDFEVKDFAVYLLISAVSGSVGGVYAYMLHRKIVERAILFSVLPVLLAAIALVMFDIDSFADKGSMCALLSLMLVSSSVVQARTTK